MGSWEDTTNWLGSYGFRLPGNPDVSRCTAEVVPRLNVVGCVASTGLARGLRPFFSMFGMQMYTVDVLTSQPAQPMGLLRRLSLRHLPQCFYRCCPCHDYIHQ